MQQRSGLIYLALALITLGLYLPALRCDFVNYDDPDYVTSNPKVQSGVTAASIQWAFTTGHASNWHPLTWLSHALDCQLYGLKPAYHHLTSLLFHMVNSLLVLLVFHRLTGCYWRSALVAAAFAWHPLHVESVAWVSERKDVLSTCFWLLTMLTYHIYTKATGDQKRSKWAWYALTLGLFSLGLMSKPMLVTLPFALLLLDYWPLNRLQLAGTGTPTKGKPISKGAERASTAHLILEKLPFLAIAVSSSVVTFFVQQKGGAVSSLNSLSFPERLSNALVSYLRYTGKLFWPANLSVLYPHPGHWPWWFVTLATVFVVTTSIMVLLQVRQRPYLAVGWLWFLGTLVPVIGLVQVGVQSMADRYTYVPMLGLFVMLAWGIPELVGANASKQKSLALGSGVILGLWVLLTSSQISYWTSSERLFRHAVEVTKDNYLAYNNLGFFLDHDGKVEEAMDNYKKSLAINPNYEDALNNMGYALEGKGMAAEALPYYEAALRTKPNMVEVHNNIGNALSDLGRVDEAISHYETALRLKPDHADAHGNYGVALAMKGRIPEATRELNEAIRLKPTLASAHSNLGNVFAMQHQLAEARAQYELAIQMKPGDSQSHNNLGNVFVELGKLEDAAKEYSEAIRLKPNNPETHFNLGVVYLRQGRKSEALVHFKEAIRYKPNYVEAQRQVEALSVGQ